MKKIFKYGVPITDEFHLVIPEGFKPLTFQFQNDTPYFWALVDTDAKPISVKFAVIGTGEPIPKYECMEYIGTAQQRVFVWHLFHVKKGR